MCCVTDKSKTAEGVVSVVLQTTSQTNKRQALIGSQVALIIEKIRLFKYTIQRPNKDSTYLSNTRVITRGMATCKSDHLCHAFIFEMSPLHFYIFSELVWLLFCNPVNRPNSWLHTAPVIVVPVLAPLQQVLPTLVVGMLIGDRGTFEHFAGVYAVPALVEGRHIICHLHRLTFKVWPLPNLQPPRG